MGKRPSLHLIDGSGYIFRAYHAVRPLTTRSGMPTQAVIGFARMVIKLLREEKPTLLGMAFDTSEPTFRHTLYKGYKAHRHKPPEDLVPQFAFIHAWVQAMNIPILIQPGYEADDILATLSHQAVHQGYDVVLVSGDKDLMQLVDPHVTLWDPLKEKRFDTAAVVKRFGVEPAYVADILALAGDASDNIPGVPSVGPKGAAKLVHTYGHLEAALAALQQASYRTASEQAVLAHADQARLSKRLAVLATDVPMHLDTHALLCKQPCWEKLEPFLQHIEAYSLLKDVKKAYPSTPAAAFPEASVTSAAVDQPSDLCIASSCIDRSVYQTIVTYQQLDAMVAHIQATRRLSIDLETTSLDPSRAEIVGIALCVPNHPAAYIPVGHHYLGVPDQLSRKDVLEKLKVFLEDPSVEKYGQNLKYDTVVFKSAGIHLEGIRHDAMLAAYVWDAARASYSLDALAKTFLNHQTITYNDVTGTGKNRIGFEQVPIEVATPYAAEDADVALQLCMHVSALVDQAGLTHVYQDIEIPLVPVLAHMESCGVKVDRAHLQKLQEEFSRRLLAIEDEALAHIGAPINLASPKQLAYLFFEKLGYPVSKKTKTGYSTNQAVLEDLARIYELPRIILKHRQLSKLKSTYIDALSKMAYPQTDRVHTHFNQTGTSTGRLSSSDPNLQNIPIRSEDGRRIRAAFVAPEGWEIISADYSQVELRIMAHLSEDVHFIEAFKQDQDIHLRTAQEILHDHSLPIAELRRRAKTINFGILYGLGEFGLAKQLGISRAQAKAYRSLYFSRYPSIQTFLDSTIEQGRKNGYVATLTGRRRYLPDLCSRNHTVRQSAERIAMNMPIQGSAADLIKIAMVRVYKRLQQERFQARLLLQVHDELVLEAPTEEHAAITQLLCCEMGQALPLRVPLKIDVGAGPNWAEAHA